MGTETTATPTPTNEKKGGFLGVADFLFDFLETFSIAVIAVVLLFTFCLRLCVVEGPSMEDTLHDKELLLLTDVAYTPKQGDIVVFHLSDPNFEKTLVKRVIAVGGQTVRLNFPTGEIYVDDVLYDDLHATLKNPSGTYLYAPQHNYDSATGIFSATVPEGCLFVLGDNRNNSKDSRSADVGFVDARCVLGKAVLRLSPFTVFSDK